MRKEYFEVVPLGSEPLMESVHKDVEQTIFYNKFWAMAFGNMLEFYDFAIFGSLADIIGELFFPQAGSNPNIRFLKALSIWGAAFFMRPIGGMLLGKVGDKVGRKVALEISVIMMLVTSLLMGCLPTFNLIGYYATGLLVALRLLQGIAVGGELVGAFIYTIEATKTDKGFWGACCKASGSLGSTIGMGLSTLLRGVLSSNDMMNWGWRISFFGGIFFGFAGWYLRSKLGEEGENADYKRLKLHGDIKSNQIVTTFRAQWREIILVISCVSLWGCGYYTCFVWMVYYMKNPDLIGKRGIDSAWLINFIMNFLLVLGFPIGGHLGDLLGKRIGSDSLAFRYMLQIAALGMAIVSVPAFYLIANTTLLGSVCGQFCFVVCLSLYGGNLPAFIVSEFDLSLRYTGLGIAYNVANALFAGTAPLFQSYLILSAPESSNTKQLRPAYYLTVLSLSVFIVISVFAPVLRDRRMSRLMDQSINKT